MNDSAPPQFLNWDDYTRFARSVRSAARYVWDADQTAFVETVLATIRERDVVFRPGHSFYRAQIGVDIVDRTDDEGNWIGEDMWGFGARRMKPLTDRAREGRANPTGIPVLYVATSPETAVAEVRPWIGADISVAQCRLARPMKTLDLTRGHVNSSVSGPVFRHIVGGRELTSSEKEAAVWAEIDEAFSEPVTGSDDRAEYAPTQVLAEVFRNAGYDAIGYRSQFGDDGDRGGYNVAIFDPEIVEIAACAPWRVNSIRVGASQNGNPWMKKEF